MLTLFVSLCVRVCVCAATIVSMNSFMEQEQSAPN